MLVGIIVNGLSDLYVSNTLKQLDDSISYLIESSQSIDYFSTESELLLSRNISRLSYYEKIMFSAGVSVVQSSYSYWSNSTNWGKWHDFWTSIGVSTPSRLTSTQQGVIAADWGGAVSGGLSTGITLAAAGPGGALAGFLFGSVAYGTLASAEAYALSKIFNL